MDKRATVPAPQHDYLVCIDSDGCAFDTMEIKHKECFCPAFIKVFGLQPISKYVREAWEYGNLYSVHRGRSRFIEILLVFDWLAEREEVRREIFVAVFEYVADVGLERQEKTLKRLKDEPLRNQLVELALDYIRFLVENPQLRSVLMVNDQPADETFLHVKARISDLSKELIIRFCAEQQIDLRVARVKMYVVRSYIYGFALMFCNKELPYNDQMTRFIRALIHREIDLPWKAGFTEADLSRGTELIEYLAKLGPDVAELRREIAPNQPDADA